MWIHFKTKILQNTPYQPLLKHLLTSNQTIGDEIMEKLSLQGSKGGRGWESVTWMPCRSHSLSQSSGNDFSLGLQPLYSLLSLQIDQTQIVLEGCAERQHKPRPVLSHSPPYKPIISRLRDAPVCFFLPCIPRAISQTGLSLILLIKYHAESSTFAKKNPATSYF